ncbi:MAG: TenA family protein [Reyranella sp.]|jgi:thiaminase/transcriptional activator TenA|uniref:TenA family protein n=1 Tax=Reyranella sp. TaxID=1929291 RepID=UPI000A864FDC|nr:TenA family protein [Reyranella sp.]MBR2817892.1 TenA family protein [Reyranella sp.]
MTPVEVAMAEASAQAAGPQPLSATLWAANMDLAERVRAHGFVRGLADGSLQIQRFKGYVAQDAYFLEAFARAYAFCLANSTSRDDLYGFADLIAGVLQELKLHKGYAERWQVDLSCVTPVGATSAYVDFLLTTARRGDLGETLAAMTPCMRLYAFLGRSLAATNVAPLYAEWIKTYADPGFEALAASIEKLLDAHAEDCEAVHAAYRRAMELEYDFFDASR